MTLSKLSDTMALEICAGRPKRIDIPDTEANYWLGEASRPGDQP